MDNETKKDLIMELEIMGDTINVGICELVHAMREISAGLHNIAVAIKSAKKSDLDASWDAGLKKIAAEKAEFYADMEGLSDTEILYESMANTPIDIAEIDEIG